VRVATSLLLVALLLPLLPLPLPLKLLLLLAFGIVNNAAQSSYNCDTRRVKHVALTDNTELITKKIINYKKINENRR